MNERSTTPARLLLLEDNRRDAELAQALLREAGVDFDARVVDSKEAFVAGLQDAPHLILADFSLPSFDGLKALELARELAPDVPFIFLSGGLGEEVAIDSLTNGATDYVLKHRIDRLVPAVRRALREVGERAAREALARHREQLVDRLRRQAEQLRKLANVSVVIASAESQDDVVTLLASSASDLLGGQAVYVTAAGDGGKQHVHVTAPLDSDSPRDLSEIAAFAAELTGPALMGRDEVLAVLPRNSMAKAATLAAVLLTSRKGERVGAVIVTGSAPFTHEDLAVLTQLAQFASAALENVRLYREARAANRAKDDFLATLAHELRTPVTAILGWVQMLAEGQLDEEMTVAARQMIESSARVQAQIVDDVLDVSRIITGKLSISFSPVELGPLVERAVETFRGPAEARGLRLSAEIRTAPVSIWGDATRVQQILWNLMSNATKFTPEGGEIVVTLDRKGSFAEICVRDTGEGIHADFLPHVFERYRQQDGPVTTRVHGGLGIGLAIVKHLAEIHDGTIEAESEGEGRGARFTLRFPLRVVVAHQQVDDERLDDVRVLVVDDDETARTALAEVLSGHGADVFVADSVRDALRSAREFAPAVIVSDIAMPGEDGYALIRQLDALRLEMGQQLPAVALTAHGRSEERMRILGSGFRHYVQKPVRAVELVQAIRAVAEERAD